MSKTLSLEDLAGVIQGGQDGSFELDNGNYSIEMVPTNNDYPGVYGGPVNAKLSGAVLRVNGDCPSVQLQDGLVQVYYENSAVVGRPSGEGIGVTKHPNVDTLRIPLTQPPGYSLNINRDKDRK